MSELVPAEDIEAIVGATRHALAHRARAVSAEGKVFILHSGACWASRSDLRLCPYSVALDRGIDVRAWHGSEDVPVVVDVDASGLLVPRDEVKND